MKARKVFGKFVGPGYVRVGPATAGCFGVGCLLPILATLLVIVLAVVAI